MNHPVFPEYRPESFQPGQRVQVRAPNGQVMHGEIAPLSSDDRKRLAKLGFKNDYFEVRTETGESLVAHKSQLFPAAIATVQAQEQEAQRQHSPQTHSPQSLAEHLKGGGQAFYSPPGSAAESSPGGATQWTPVHDVWMSDPANLPELIDFDAVGSGQAAIRFDNPVSKPKIPRFRGLSQGEVAGYIRGGGDFQYWDDDIKSAKPDGGLSLSEMLQDRQGLGTDENVARWFQHMMQRDQAPGPGDDAAGSGGSGDGAAGSSGSARGGSAVDALQTGLDAAGVLDPTPIADGTNMLISLGRAVKNPGQAGRHLKNAAISGISMFPYVGDMAKGLKYGAKGLGAASKTARTGRNSVKDRTNFRMLNNLADAVASAAQPTEEGQSHGGWVQSLMAIAAETFGGDTGPDSKSTGAKPGKPKRGQKPSAGDAAEPASGGGSGGAGDSGSGSGGGAGGSGGDSGGNSNGGSSNGGSSDSPPPSDPNQQQQEKNLGGFRDKLVETTGAVGKMTVAALAWTEAQSFMNKTVIEYNRNLLKFNGELAAAYAGLDAQRLHRDLRQASRQAAPLSGLIDAQNSYEDASFNNRNTWITMATDIQTTLTKGATIIQKIYDAVSPIEEIYMLIRSYIPWLKPDGQPGQGGPALDRLNEARRRAADAQKRGRKV